jgi:hypothetical protein
MRTCSPSAAATPTAPGGSAELKAESIKEFSYPDGAAWRGRKSTMKLSASSR